MIQLDNRHEYLNIKNASFSISAKILNGKKVTSTPRIRDDMENAGAIWYDEPVVTDGHLVSSRRPPDLPDYMREFIRVLEQK